MQSSSFILFFWHIFWRFLTKRIWNSRMKNVKFIRLTLEFLVYIGLLSKIILKQIFSKKHLQRTLTLKNPEQFLKLEEMYCGAKVAILLNEITGKVQENELRNFKLRVLDFYIELALQIKIRSSLNNFNISSKFFTTSGSIWKSDEHFNRCSKIFSQLS